MPAFPIVPVLAKLVESLASRSATAPGGPLLLGIPPMRIAETSACLLFANGSLLPRRQGVLRLELRYGPRGAAVTLCRKQVSCPGYVAHELSGFMPP